MATLQKIKLLALQKDIPLSKLAEQCSITHQALNKIIRTNTTSIETLEKIATVLGVSVGYFFDECSSNVAIKTEGDYSPATKDGDISVVVGDSILAERVKSLQQLIEEKDVRIAELKERIEELKAK